MDPINGVGVNNYQVEVPKKDEVVEYDNNYQTLPPMYDYTEEKEQSSRSGIGMMALAALGIAGLSLYGGRVWGKNAAKSDAQAEVKKLMDTSKEEAAKLLNDTKEESQKLLDDAKTEGQKLLDDARAEGKKILDDAKAEGKKFIDATKEKAQAMIDDANEKVLKATKRMTDIENRQNKALELANEKTGFWGKLFGIQKLKNKFKAILTPEAGNTANNEKGTSDKTADKIKDAVKDIKEAGTSRTYNM